MFETKVVEKIITHILRSVTLFSKNRTVYEIMWKNVLGPNRPQMVICRIRVACWILKGTNTHSEYVMLIDFSTATMVAQTPLDVTLCYTYIK